MEPCSAGPKWLLLLAWCRENILWLLGWRTIFFVVFQQILRTSLEWGVHMCTNHTRDKLKLGMLWDSFLLFTLFVRHRSPREAIRMTCLFLFLH